MNSANPAILIELLKASVDIEGEDAFITYDKLLLIEKGYPADLIDELMMLENLRIMDKGILIPKKYFE